MLDAISHFTNGLCVPTTNLDAISYFRTAYFGEAAARGRGGISYGWERRQREEFIGNAKEDAEFLAILIAAVAVINQDQ